MSDPSPKSAAPVLVTGATGYVAGRLIELLLQRGHTVHGTVRDPSNAERRAYLDALAADAPGELKLFGADLLAEGAFAEAMAGCEVVFHTASPFTTQVTDPQKDLVDPAVQGTRNVLAQANATPSVKRVVVTSSCAAIYGDNADVAQAPDGVLTEAVWNTSSTLAHQPYSYSKTEAERAAWAIHDAQDRWRLVTVNPSLVLGPGVTHHGSSESYKLLTQFVDGTFRAGVPRYGMGVVDVREVAEAHYQAGFRPDAEGRHIVSGHNSDLADFAAIVRGLYADRLPVPRRVMPKWLVWLVGPLANKAMTRKVVSLNADVPFRADHSKSVRALGLTYRPLEDTVRDHVDQLIAVGAVKAKA
ncbi:MAG: NAD-dependent epimerase/dehydratase family protein [Myxococcales bacterium]|nr:NAD-dependent epimerase/dehydratase family protein [Myxococcales bacterium]